MSEDSRTRDTSPPTSRPSIVVIISDGPLLDRGVDSITGRAIIHVPILVTNWLLPMVATTIATGVDPMTHGIASTAILEPTDLSRRAPEAEDRLYPCFWTGAAGSGLRTVTIDWPATEGDPDLPDSISPGAVSSLLRERPEPDASALSQLIDQNTPGDDVQRATLLLARLETVFSEAQALLNSPEAPDLLGIVLRGPRKLIPVERMLPFMEPRIENLISSIAEQSHVLIVHHPPMEAADGSMSGSPTLSVIGGQQVSSGEHLPIHLRSIGGAVYLLAGVPCPAGVTLPRWPFLPLPEARNEDRLIPAGIKEDSTDWNDLVNRVLELPEDSEGKLDRSRCVQTLVERFNTLSMNLVQNRRWDSLEQLGEWLVRLRGLPVDYWLHIYSLERLDKRDELAVAIDALVSAFPGLRITAIAESLLSAEGDEATVAKLEAVNPGELGIETALGTLGRLCLRFGLEEKGIAAISMAIEKRASIPTDRIEAAQHLLDTQQPEAALRFMGPLGRDVYKREISILRLSILLALGDSEGAKELASLILEQYPGDAQVLRMVQV